MLAVDQSVLLLKSGNDITTEMVKVNMKILLFYFNQLFRLKAILLSTVREMVTILAHLDLEGKSEQFAFGVVGGSEEKTPTQYLK